MFKTIALHCHSKQKLLMSLNNYYISLVRVAALMRFLERRSSILNHTSKSRKYKVKYKHKLGVIEYLFLSIIPFGLFMSLKIIQSNLLDSFDYQIPIFLYIVPFILLVFFWFWIYYKSKISFSMAQKTKAKLFHIIKTNRFYFSEKLGESEKVSSSLTFIFYFTNSKLIIDAYAYGASYTKKINELSDLLESALSLNLLEINSMNPDYTRYEFLLTSIERLYINEINDIPINIGKIQLDNEKFWDYSKTPHALVAGATSAGKTYMLFYLILQFAKQSAEIYILDPKRSDLSSLKFYIPNGENYVANTPTQIANVLRNLNDEMNLRYDTYFNNETSKMGVNYQYFKLRPIVIFYDEVAASIEEDKKIAKEIDSYLKQLIMKGRQSGIFLILSTQKPNAEAISTSVRDQMGLRIGLGQLSRTGYRMTLGDDWEELPSVETGTGRGLIFIDGLNWSTPRAYETPYLDLERLEFEKSLKILIEEGNSKYCMKN